MSSPILFLLASAIWGSTFWAITLQLGHASPAVSVVYRFTIASLTLFAMCKARGDKLWLPWRTQAWLAAHGACAFTISYVCTYSSEQYLVSALVSVLFTLLVIWTPLGERLFFGKALTARIWLTAIMSMIGVFLLFSQPILASFQQHGAEVSSHQYFGLGLTLALIATLASAAANLLVVKVREQSKNVFLTTAWAMAWGSLFVALFVGVRGDVWNLPTATSYWVSLIYLALFGSVIAFSAYFVLIDRIGGHKAVYVGVVTPVISVLLSIQFEQYRPGLIEWLGMALCLAGVVLAVRGESQPSVQVTQTQPKQT
ncbi:MAG: EamA family transporter [Burkholderiales bacterium]|nr:EamA family transporter [Burkholderiales bacterium]